MNRLKRIGTLQEYAEPFVSLYYNYGDTSYNLFIRNNKFGDRIKTYLILSITIPQLVAYFNNEIGLNDIVTYTKPIVAELQKSGTKLINCQDVDKNHCYEVIKGSENFDPDYCINYSDILYYLSEKSNLNIDEIKL